VLERKEHPLILRLFAGEHGGVFSGADRDMASPVGSASEGKKGPEPHSAPALAEPTPAFAAVEVRHQHGKDLVRIEGVRGSNPLSALSSTRKRHEDSSCWPDR
jgi:hypothetical protein